MPQILSLPDQAVCSFTSNVNISLLTSVLGLGGVSYDFGDSTEISRTSIEPSGVTHGSSHFVQGCPENSPNPSP